MDEVAKAVETAASFEKLGIIAVLFLVCLWLGYLYLQERKRNAILVDRLVSEVSENSKEMITTLVGVESTIGGFKSTLDSLKPYLEMVRDLVVRDRRGDDSGRSGGK